VDVQRADVKAVDRRAGNVRRHRHIAESTSVPGLARVGRPKVTKP
jgi:hypothetical protein